MAGIVDELARPFVRKRRFFHRFGTRRDVQLTVIWRWEGVGVRTWPPAYSGRQKRAVHFGVGYVSWRIDAGVR